MDDSQKACTKCSVVKPLTEFAMKKRKTGSFPASWCKQCTREYQRDKWYRNGKPRQGWQKLPRDQWPPERREAMKAMRTRYRRKKGIPARAEIAEETARRRKEIEAQSKANKLDRSHVRALRIIAHHSCDFRGWTDRERSAWRQRNDPQYAVNQRMRVQIRKAMKGKKAGRRWESLVGYTVEELVAHLEWQLPRGWTIADFFDKGWHIDHIIPKSQFDVSSEEGLAACWALPNLRPLPAERNHAKGARRETLL